MNAMGIPAILAVVLLLAVGTNGWDTPHDVARQLMRQDGKVMKLGPLDAYVVSPPGAKAKTTVPAVLIYTDIYGFAYNNTRAWADRLAKQGFTVVVPDFFRGDYWSDVRRANGEDFMAWMMQFPEAVVMNQTRAVVSAMRKANLGGAKVGKLGAQGFCWGGKYALQSTHGNKPLSSASVVYHGSLVTLQDVARVNAPVMFQQSDPAIDFLFNTTFYEATKRTLAAKKMRSPRFVYQIEYYPGMQHGFALRGNMSDPAAARASNQAFNKGAAFLKTHLK